MGPEWICDSVYGFLVLGISDLNGLGIGTEAVLGPETISYGFLA